MGQTIVWPQGLYNMNDWIDTGEKIEYKYSFWPRRCCKSGKLLCFTTAVRVRKFIEWYDGIEAHTTAEDQWYDSSEGLIMMIKKVSE